MDPRGTTPNDDNATQDAKGRLRRAIAAVSSGTGSRSELEAAACKLVEDLRQQHQPPEQMLLQIKELLAESGLRATYANGDGPLGHEATVYRDVIAMSIRYYYARDDRPTGEISDV